MKKSRFTDEQIIGILRDVESGRVTGAEACRQHGITGTTFYRWKREFGTDGSGLSDARRVRELERENARLKKALAEAVLTTQVLKEINEKKW